MYLIVKYTIRWAIYLSVYGVFNTPDPGWFQGPSRTGDIYKMKHIQLFEQFKKEDSLIESAADKKLPQNIQKLIDELAASGVGITQAHINKEYEQERDTRLDSGGVNPEA